MIVGHPKLPAVCGSCDHRVPYTQITEQQYRMLLDAYYHQKFVEELRMLNKVADFYRRNPLLEGRWPPDKSEHPADGDVIDYLRYHTFKLVPRLQFVSEKVELTKRASDQVLCTRCTAGHMELSSNNAGDLGAE